MIGFLRRGGDRGTAPYGSVHTRGRPGKAYRRHLLCGSGGQPAWDELQREHGPSETSFINLGQAVLIPVKSRTKTTAQQHSHAPPRSCHPSLRPAFTFLARSYTKGCTCLPKTHLAVMLRTADFLAVERIQYHVEE